MKKWVDENKKPDGSDYDIYKDGLKIYTTIRECSCMLKRLFLLTWQIFRKNFYSGKKNKNAPFVGISDKETQRILTNAMKASNRWSV
jgi:penicillin-binding protein 1A